MIWFIMVPFMLVGLAIAILPLAVTISREARAAGPGASVGFDGRSGPRTLEEGGTSADWRDGPPSLRSRAS